MQTQNVVGALLPSQPWQAAGSHPFVVCRHGYGATGHFYVECACRKCGDHWGKLCHHPERVNYWVTQYIIQHSHGLRPVVPGRSV